MANELLIATDQTPYPKDTPELARKHVFSGKNSGWENLTALLMANVSPVLKVPEIIGQLPKKPYYFQKLPNRIVAADHDLPEAIQAQPGAPNANIFFNNIILVTLYASANVKSNALNNPSEPNVYRKPS